MIVDVEMIKKFFTNCGFINDGDEIPAELSYFFKDFSQEKLTTAKMLFVPHTRSPGRPYGKYRCEIRCPQCNSSSYREISKFKYLEYIKELRHINSNPFNEGGYYRSLDDKVKMAEKKKDVLCSTCYELFNKDIQDKVYSLLSVDKENSVKTANELADYWLNPHADFRRKGLAPYAYYSYEKTFKPYKDEIHDFIKVNLTYQEFLQTPLWKLVSLRVKQEANFKCKLCNSSKNLQAHHRSYELLGYEFYQGYKNLVCICNECHDHHHDKEGAYDAE